MFLRFFIYSQIKEFGALVFAATMNVRQVVSILVSYAARQREKGSLLTLTTTTPTPTPTPASTLLTKNRSCKGATGASDSR